MTKEEYVRMLIAGSGHTLKSFAESISLPYTTLLGMLSRGLGRASVQNVIRICRGLSITVEELLQVEDEKSAPFPFYISDREKMVLTKYREKSEMRTAIDTLLGIETDK